MKGKVSKLVIAALKQLGKEGITVEIQQQFTKVLQKESLENIKHDAQLAPEWISKLILQTLTISENDLD